MRRRSVLSESLKSHLGRTWPLALLIVAVLVLWPVLVFRGAIAFSPERFTEEWIKTLAEGLVLLMILEILRTRQLSMQSRTDTAEWIDGSFREPALSLLAGLDRYSTATAYSEPDRIKEAQRFLGLMSGLEESLALRQVPTFVSPQALKHLHDSAETVTVARCQALLADLCPGGKLSPNPRSEELEELRSRLIRFLAMLP